MNKKYLISSVSAMVLLLANPVWALTAEDLDSSKNISWEKVDTAGDNTVEIKTPDGVEFFKYTYTMPEGYTELNGNDNRITNPSENVDSKVIKDIVSDGTLFEKDSYYSYYGGGAIFNHENTEAIDITSDFINNNITRKYFNNQSYGGAILNTSAIKNITGDFVGNTATTQSAQSSDAGGGAIANLGAIESISGDFVANYALSQSTNAAGGAIFNSGTINNITSNFIGNQAISESAISLGGVIYNGYNSTIKNLSGNFIGNVATAKIYGHGGVLYNYGTINNISGNFIGNHLDAASSSSGYYSQGGAINNSGTIDLISGATFTGNYIASNSGVGQGGAIYNNYKIGDIVNSSFFNNHVEGVENSGGGAIYSTYNLKITADNGTSEFTDNYADVNGEQTDNAIYMSSASKTLTLNALNKGQILFNDEIDGAEGYAIALIGDDTGSIDFKNNFRNANVSLEKTNVNLFDVKYLDNNNSLTITSGKFNVVHLGMDDYLTANAINLNDGVLNMNEADVDLEVKKMGTINGDVLSITDGLINVDKMLISKDGAEGETRVDFIVGENIPQANVTVGETVAPIYKYEVSYDVETGEFVFTRGDKIIPDEIVTPSPIPTTPIRRANNFKAFNPGVFANDVAVISGSNMQGAAVNQLLNQQLMLDYSKGRFWATPFYSDDTISYSGFYDIDSTNYGLIAGIDSKAYGDTNGWTRVYTVFGAYNDGEDKYQGVKVDTKSWLVGLKASVFNGGFYGDALVNYAWHDSDQTTAFGTDSVDTTGYGAALKAGYKHDFNKVNVDTSLMLSWQQVEGKDFTSKSGARFDTDDYSRLSLVPQIKVGYSLDNIRPYALARYNFALSEDGSTTVNNSLALPEIESKDYVEYGLGVETTTSFPHSGYAHVLRHDGGREGWSVTAGYRYNF